MKTRLPYAIAAFVLLAACVGKEEKPVVIPDVLRGAPVLNGSRLIDTSGTAEAARAVFVVQQGPDSVAAAYRRYLTANGWRIVGDVSDQGGTDLYVERQGPPLWIQIRPGENGTTRYILIGALGRSVPKPDSAAGGASRPPAQGAPR